MITPLCQLCKFEDIVVRLQDKGSRFVILDRNDYIDKVESNLSDGSFDILSSDPSLTFYRAVKGKLRSNTKLSSNERA